MKTTARGDTVKVHYTGKLADGTVFDSSVGRDPIEFTLGSGSLIPGFETAVEGLAVGEKKTVVVGPEDAYGVRDDGKVMQVDQADLPDEIDPKPGMVLQARTEGGATRFTVTQVTDDTVTLDANHPLAGKQLTFEMEVMEITRP